MDNWVILFLCLLYSNVSITNKCINLDISQWSALFERAGFLREIFVWKDQTLITSWTQPPLLMNNEEGEGIWLCNIKTSEKLLFHLVWELATYHQHKQTNLGNSGEPIAMQCFCPLLTNSYVKILIPSVIVWWSL